MNSIFKANDVRGKYPEEINEDAVFQIAKALGKYFGKNAKLVAGCDARLSSPALYEAMLKGLGIGVAARIGIVKRKTKTFNDTGGDNQSVLPKIIIKAGSMTTPMLYFLVNKLKADGGIMVTASHNPKEYNGLKIVGKKAVPISGKEVQRLVIRN